MHTVRASGISETSPKHLHHVCFCVSSGVLLGLLPSRPFHSNDERFVTCVCRCAQICLEVDWGSISNEQSFVGIFHHNFPILSTSMNEWKMYMKWWDWAFFSPSPLFHVVTMPTKEIKVRNEERVIYTFYGDPEISHESQLSLTFWE